MVEHTMVATQEVQVDQTILSLMLEHLAEYTMDNILLTTVEYILDHMLLTTEEYTTVAITEQDQDQLTQSIMPDQDQGQLML